MDLRSVIYLTFLIKRLTPLVKALHRGAPVIENHPQLVERVRRQMWSNYEESFGYDDRTFKETSEVARKYPSPTLACNTCHASKIGQARHTVRDNVIDKLFMKPL